MKFKNHKQHRLRHHDYSSFGYYFVTICTKNRMHYFGKIKNGVMDSSEIGEIAGGQLNSGAIKIIINIFHGSQGFMTM